MSRQMNCPRCMLYGDTVAMVPKPPDYFKCPNCGTEVWPKRMGEAAEAVNRENEENCYVSMSLQPGEKTVGGGGSTGKPKKAGKKRSLAQINAMLADSYHNH